MGGDAPAAVCRPLTWSFNPRPRMGGDRSKRLRLSLPISFNPRPRMGGDSSRSRCLPLPRSFNPRPRMGGDNGTTPGLGGSAGFNPRPRMGGDGAPISTGAKSLRVSIRAPAWGATRIRLRCSYALGRFNPRPRMGGDLGSRPRRRSSRMFQSAPPHGGRRRDRICLLKNVKFASGREPVFTIREIPRRRHYLLGNPAKNHSVAATANPSSYS